MKRLFFYCAVLTLGVILRDRGEACSSYYDTLKEYANFIPQEWGKERLPTPEATEKSQEILNLVLLPKNAPHVQELSSNELEVIGEALVSSTLYELRRERVEKTTFELPSLPLNASPLFLKYRGGTDVIILGVREVHHQLLKRLAQLFGTCTHYPFDQNDFRGDLAKNILEQISSSANKDYKSAVEDVLKASDLISILFKQFEKFDSQYDIKTTEDFQKEVRTHLHS